jgi:hypothetical protein
MLPLAERQGMFAAALLDPQRPIPPGCVGPDGKADVKRFAVYRNNVIVGLTEALLESYPAVRRILGEQCFRALAPLYIRECPPSSPVLLEYGATFPDFLPRVEALERLPYLRDVARIERAWLDAYHAPEAVPLDPATLARGLNDRSGEVCFTLHPSLRIIRSSFPALTIWRMNIAEGAPSPVDLEAGGEDVLIVRPQADVEVRHAPLGGAELLAALGRGECLDQAAEAALAVAPSFELGEHLTVLLSAGVFVDWHRPSGEV